MRSAYLLLLIVLIKDLAGHITWSGLGHGKKSQHFHAHQASPINHGMIHAPVHETFSHVNKYHGAWGHGALHHGALEHRGLDHGTLDHGTLDHIYVGYGALGHISFDNRAVQHRALDHGMLASGMFGHHHGAMGHGGSGNGNLGYQVYHGQSYNSEKSNVFHQPPSKVSTNYKEPEKQTVDYSYVDFDNDYDMMTDDVGRALLDSFQVVSDKKNEETMSEDDSRKMLAHLFAGVHKPQLNNFSP